LEDLKLQAEGKKIILVSIPLWFDWKFKSQNLIPVIKMFQFHFGSIGSTIGKKVKAFNCLFQFHFGSIGRIELLNDNSKSKKVSIPLWFDWKSY